MTKNLLPKKFLSSKILELKKILDFFRNNFLFPENFLSSKILELQEFLFFSEQFHISPKKMELKNFFGK